MSVLSALSPARRRLFLSVSGVLVVLVLAGLAVGTRSGDQAPSVPQDVPGPVLLVPGYGGSVSSLQALATVLRAEGKDATVVTLPGGAVGDLAEQAEALDLAAQQAMRRTGARSVDVVGYSAGGVVARIWLRDGGDRLARRVVTLGSPHNGTELALLAVLVSGRCPVACRQLASGSELLDGLRGDGLPTGPRVVSIWSTSDDVVAPPESAVLDGATNVSVQSVCTESRVAHGGLPRDPVVHGLVLDALGPSAVPTWTAADCARLSS